MKPTEKGNERDLYWRLIALLLWVIPSAAITAWVIINPLYRDVTTIYHDAVVHFAARQAVYVGSSQFNYLPAFLLLFSPFDQLPAPIGGILWRWLAITGLFVGLWRCTGLLTQENRYKAFAVVTALSIPLCLSTFRNGQSSALLAACLVLAALYLHKQQLWWATMWLCMSLVCKPLGFVAIGLAVMAFPKIWWRVVFGTVVVIVLPYLFAPTEYVNVLYVKFATNLVDCFDPPGRTFADLNGILMAFNLKLTDMPSLIVRVAAGVAMSVALWLIRGLGTDIRLAFIWLGLTGVYLMLFNPMNEANSYVIVAPSIGLWAWWCVEKKITRSFQILTAISLTMLLLPGAISLMMDKSFVLEFSKFWRPLMMLVFLGILIRQMNLKLGLST